jgi:hypothetical protein
MDREDGPEAVGLDLSTCDLLGTGAIVAQQGRANPETILRIP